MRPKLLWCEILVVSCLLAQLVAAVWSLPAEKEKRLALSAMPIKTKYKAGEKVIFNFELRNTGQTDLFVARPSLHYIFLHIVGADGKQSSWCGRIDGRYISPHEFIVLHPGSAIRQPVIISCDEGKIRGYEIHGAGKYVVGAEYLVQQPIGVLRKMAGSAEIVTSPVRAPEVSFWIAPRESGRSSPGPSEPRYSK